MCKRNNVNVVQAREVLYKYIYISEEAIFCLVSSEELISYFSRQCRSKYRTFHHPHHHRQNYECSI
jgi:hypothetical protein